MITLISITTTISGLICLTSGFYVFLKWKKEGGILLQTFAMFLLSIGLQMVCLTIGLAVFFDNNSMSILFWWIGHMFLLLAMSQLIILPVRIKFPSKENLVRKISISYVIVGGLVLLLNLSNIKLFRSPDNIINWDVPGLNIAVIFIAAGVSMIFSVYVFITESLKIEDRLTKLKSLFLGIGILSFFIGGPLHNFVTNLGMAIIAASLSILGVLFLLIGIYIPVIFNKKTLK